MPKLNLKKNPSQRQSSTSCISITDQFKGAQAAQVKMIASSTKVVSRPEYRHFAKQNSVEINANEITPFKDEAKPKRQGSILKFPSAKNLLALAHPTEKKVTISPEQHSKLDKSVTYSPAKMYD